MLWSIRGPEQAIDEESSEHETYEEADGSAAAGGLA